MIYNFLSFEDVKVGIKEDLLNQITADSTDIIKAEKSAVSRMKSYLEQRYDTDNIFPIIPTWKSTDNYKVAEPITETIDGTAQTYTPTYLRENSTIKNYVYCYGKMYKALQNSINKDPLSETDYWTECDPRDANIVSMCVDVLLFFLHRSINPRKIPELRLELYNDAKEWLNMVKDDEISPDLPKKKTYNEDIDNIPWGSNPARKQYWS